MDNINDTPTSTTAAAAAANYALNGKIMLCSVVILFGVVFVVIFFHTYARCCSERRSRNRDRPYRYPRHLVYSGPHMADAVLASLAKKPHGLDASLLKTLPTFVYSDEATEQANAGAAAPLECAVCLSEFEDGERGRALPQCGHAFHAPCIDAWFGSHSSCPLCRSPVVNPDTVAAETTSNSSSYNQVEIAVSEPADVSEPPRDVAGEEAGSSLASGFRAERCERKPQDLAGLTSRDDQTETGLGSSTERNRVTLSLKRIWSI